MQATRLLLIDDDQKLADVLKSYLEKYGYEVRHFARPELALKEFATVAADLVILDIMMPGMDGLRVCRELRKVSQVPIIFLSARGDAADRIVGLELGADDYIGKPFEPRELVARIESVLRRTPAAPATAASNSGHPSLEFDAQAMTVRKNGESIELTATEFQALYYLYQNHEKVVSRDELLTFLQGIDSEVYGRAIDILISRVRQKIGDDPKEAIYIKTIRGRGYRFLNGGR